MISKNIRFLIQKYPGHAIIECQDDCAYTLEVGDILEEVDMGPTKETKLYIIKNGQKKTWDNLNKMMSGYPSLN